VYLLSGGTDGRSRLSHDVVNCRVKVVVIVVASRELRDAQRVVGVWQSATDVRHYHTSQSLSQSVNQSMNQIDHDFKSGPSNEITLGSTGDIRRELKVRFLHYASSGQSLPSGRRRAMDHDATHPTQLRWHAKDHILVYLKPMTDDPSSPSKKLVEKLARETPFVCHAFSHEFLGRRTWVVCHGLNGSSCDSSGP